MARNLLNEEEIASQQEMDELEYDINDASTGTSHGIVVEPVTYDDIIKSLGLQQQKQQDATAPVPVVDEQSDLLGEDTLPFGDEPEVVDNAMPELFAIFPEDQ